MRFQLSLLLTALHASSNEDKCAARKLSRNSAPRVDACMATHQPIFRNISVTATWRVPFRVGGGAREILGLS
eukprot:3190884-Pleurochrysis_carterae.AAC.1